MGVSRPRRFPNVAWSGEEVNPEFLGNIGKNLPAAYGRRRLHNSGAAKLRIRYSAPPRHCFEYDSLGGKNPGPKC